MIEKFETYYPLKQKVLQKTNITQNTITFNKEVDIHFFRKELKTDKRRHGNVVKQECKPQRVSMMGPIPRQGNSQ